MSEPSEPIVPCGGCGQPLPVHLPVCPVPAATPAEQETAHNLGQAV